MTSLRLCRVPASDVARGVRTRDDNIARDARAIVASVRTEGEPALRRYAERFDGLAPNAKWQYDRDDMARALATLDGDVRRLLERTADRIRAFAIAQRNSLSAITVKVAGGTAGHTLIPVERAGCYAPAGRFPLPSSLLMTAVTARAAGVTDVIVATPNPNALMLGAAAIADVDSVIGVGGAHAIAALAYGVGVRACDIVVGPGNAWVTAAKRCVVGDVGIDMLAGPSELVVVADRSADPATIAADLIAQAEHDPDAFTALVTVDADIVAAVEQELEQQLTTLPTASIARASLAGGLAVVCSDPAEAARVCDALAPEHLQLSIADADAFALRMRNAGACFVGEQSAEVFGDYGMGGNHVLPTGRSARFSSGLSALTFLRVRSWLRIDDAPSVINDVAALARLEGLEGHARAAERRRSRLA